MRAAGRPGTEPARQAGLKAGLPNSLNAQTINKVCGSGLQAVMLAAQSIKAGDNQLVIAGGFENMSLAPHLEYLLGGREVRRCNDDRSHAIRRPDMPV